MQTANLSLEGRDLTKVGADAGVWENVLRKLNANEMPPGACLASDLPLIEAIKGDNRKGALALIEARTGITTAQPDGSTPLAWAAYKDDTELASLLLKARAKPGTADDYGETPLTLACANGNARIVRQFLEAGADANATRWNRETALMIAARSGNPEAVRLLIGHGAKLDAAESRKGQNALIWAAAGGHVGAVEFAFALDPDVQAVTESKQAVMHSAVSAITASTPEEVCDVIRFLAAKGAAIDPVDTGGKTPLNVSRTLPASVTELLTHLKP